MRSANAKPLPGPAPRPVSFGALARARAAAKPLLVRLTALQALRIGLKLGFLGCTAALVGKLVMDQPVPAPVLVAVPLLLAASTLIGWLAEGMQADAEAKAAIGMRAAAGERLRAMNAREVQSLPVGALAVSMQRHPEALASLVLGHRLASMMMGIGPLMAALALFIVSWQAALLVLALSPVMIVFFVLVGGEIRSRADAQERAFGRLAGQFEDRIRTLPTILANHALPGEEAKLSDRLNAYARNTMGVLRIAFLNAGIIDFFSSLSIAMLAVFLGLGHLKLAMIPGFSNLELWQSLFILMIAPEYFAPFRRFSEQYHVKAEGQAAAAALDALMDVKAPSPDIPALDVVDLDALPAAGLVAITGPSGSGKTTLLRRLCGIDGEPGALRQQMVWVGTTSFVPEGTLADAISWGIEGVSQELLQEAAERVGLLVDTHLPGGLGASVARGGGNLSGGQRLRIAVARAMVFGKAVVADEPTAKLDAVTAQRIRDALLVIATTRLVIVATHDMALAERAIRVIDLATPALREAA